MTSAAMEPSPFDEEEDGGLPAVPRPPKRKPTDPFPPFTTEELDRVSKIAPGMRLVDPWRCVYNLSATDGSLRGSLGGMVRQCPTRLADPTQSRYCFQHAMELGVAAYSPDEASAMVHAESTANLFRLVPKSIKTLEDVMDDAEAPPGIRAKAADSVLDRTGYSKGIDLHVEATVTVEDPLSKLRDRLTELREAQEAATEKLYADIVEAEIVPPTELE